MQHSTHKVNKVKRRTVHFKQDAQYTLHGTQDVQYMVNASQYTVCTVHHTQGAQGLVHTLHNTQGAQGAQYTIHTVHNTQGAQYTVHTVHNTEGAHCTVHSAPHCSYAGNRPSGGQFLLYLHCAHSSACPSFTWVEVRVASSQGC